VPRRAKKVPPPVLEMLRTPFQKLRVIRQDRGRLLHRHRGAVSLTTIFGEHYPMLCDMASEQINVLVLDNTDCAGVFSEE
jgi:hypothetical protein